MLLEYKPFQIHHLFSLPASNWCTVRGKVHYKTFDGLEYIFLSACQYKLLTDITEGSFLTIYVTNDPNININGPVKRTLTVITEDGTKNISIHKTNRGTFGVTNFKDKKEEIISLPYTDEPAISEVRCSNRLLSRN